MGIYRADLSRLSQMLLKLRLLLLRLLHGGIGCSEIFIGWVDIGESVHDPVR